MYMVTTGPHQASVALWFGFLYSSSRGTCYLPFLTAGKPMKCNMH